MCRLKNILGAIGIAAGLGQFSGIAMAAPPGAPVVTLTGTQTVTVCPDPKQATDLVVTATATNLGVKPAAYSWSSDIPGINIYSYIQQRTATGQGQALTIPSMTIAQANYNGRAPVYRVRLWVTNDQRLTSDQVEFPFKVLACTLKR